MNILVTIAQSDVLPLKVMLASLFENNPGERFTIFLVGENLQAWDFAAIASQCASQGHILWKLPVNPALLQSAPTLHYYPKTMYYRLLAAELLPEDVDRVLYLNPDILIINPIRPLYDLDLGDKLFAAAVHSGLVYLPKHTNMLRQSTHDTEGCFNAGVLLMNVPRMRDRVRVGDIIHYANAYKDYLVMPDQDLLNGLYGADILRVDAGVWNYDARKYPEYWLESEGVKSMEWVMKNVACLHFCGRNKPWRPDYSGFFGALYQRYEQLLEGLPQEGVINQTSVM